LRVDVRPMVFAFSPAAFDEQISFTPRASRGADWEQLQVAARPSFGSPSGAADTAEEELEQFTTVRRSPATLPDSEAATFRAGRGHDRPQGRCARVATRPRGNARRCCAILTSSIERTGSLATCAGAGASTVHLLKLIRWEQRASRRDGVRKIGSADTDGPRRC
jgi:hypothetical protein